MEIQRSNYMERIRRFYDSSLIKVLTGVRRCGKSVLLRQIQNDLLESGITGKDHIIAVDFEDLRFVKLRNYLKLNDYLLNLMTDDGKYYIFLDEIQHVRQFERVLSSLKATSNVSIFVTGSNSKLLSGRLATLLVGRCKEFKIRPFSYSEFLQYLVKNNKPMPTNPMQNYLRYGGMPQRLDYESEEDIKGYLKDVYNGIVEKDICGSNSKIDKESFLRISDYILSNAGKDFSAESVADYFNKANLDKVHRKDVYRYLDKMEQACLISRAKRFDIPSKRNLKTVEKQFGIDPGFILAASDSNRLFPSRALENVVYNELLLRGYDVKIGKTYKGEIDFVAMKDGKKCFIQVAFMLSDEEVLNREFGAFSPIKDFSPKYVLSLDEFDYSQNGIIHINVEDWLNGKANITVA